MCQYTPDNKRTKNTNQTKMCAIMVFYVYFVLYIELLFGNVDLNGSLKSKILNEFIVSNYGAFDLGLGTDYIVEAIMIPGNEYFATPFNVSSHWYGVVYQNVPKYPIVTGVGIQEGTKVYYRSIN